MTTQHWGILISLYGFALLMLYLKRSTRTPVMICHAGTLIGLIVGVFFFAWMTRTLGREIRVLNPSQKTYVSLTQELRQSSTNQRALIAASRIKDFLLQESKSIPRELEEVIRMTTEGTPAGLEKARSIQIDEHFGTHRVTRTYRFSEMILLAMSVFMLFVYFVSFPMDRKLRRASLDFA